MPHGSKLPPYGYRTLQSFNDDCLASYAGSQLPAPLTPFGISPGSQGIRTTALQIEFRNSTASSLGLRPHSEVFTAQKPRSARRSPSSVTQPHLTGFRENPTCRLPRVIGHEGLETDNPAIVQPRASSSSDLSKSLLPWGLFPYGVISSRQPRSFPQVPIPTVRSAFRVSHPLSGFIHLLPPSLVSCRNAYGVFPSKLFPRAEFSQALTRLTTLLRLGNPAFVSRSQPERPLRSNRLASETQDALLPGPPSNTEPNLLGAVVNIAPGSLLPWAFVSPGLFSTKGRLGFRLASPRNLGQQRLHTITAVHRGLSLSRPTEDLSAFDRPLEIPAPRHANSPL